MADNPNNNDDIREIFRRAFEQSQRGGFPGGGPPSGGTGGDGGDDSPRPQRPQIPQMPTGWWRDRRIVIGGLLFLFITSFNWIISTYTDFLWFNNLSYQDLFVRSVVARVATFLSFFLIAFIVLWGNARIAFRGAMASTDGFQPANFAGFRYLFGFVAAFLSFVFGSAASTLWEEILLFIFRSSSSIQDPVFGQDLTFYFFELPVYKFLQGWFIPLLFFSLIGIFIIYAMHNIEGMRTSTWRPLENENFRRHVAAVGAFLALLLAMGHWFGRYDLLIDALPDDLVAGAGYTDLTISARVLVLNATLMLLLAAALAFNAFRYNLRPVFAIGIMWIFSVVVLNGLLPGIVERYVVQPNQLGRERPYLEHSINFTREAYGLDEVEVREFGDVEPIVPSDLTDNADALKNIRLWDYRVLPENYEQLQALRPYYKFGDVDIDRYEINGEMRQVMLAGREVDKNLLNNQSWENLRLEFTHGYGIVMNPVDRFTREGQPEFFISDVPPNISVDLELTRPEIYYGELTREDDIVYVGTPRGEVDYPFGDENVRTIYEGSGGVPIGNFLRRMALAIRFTDINLLLNEDITPTTRVMFNRGIEQRIRTITPFLALDDDPYIVLADGRLVWMADAYTISRSHPYSEKSTLSLGTIPSNINYIRNAAKVVVDAYDGSVTYYLADTEDPITRTYARVFPTLFKPLDEMPEAIQAHIRYPESLFRIQTEQYLEYHMTDVGVFFNKEDLWAIPEEEFQNSQSQEIEPYYVMFNLPGEEAVEYLLIQPYTPANKENMVAWIAARNDGENYGQLISYTMPKQQVVLGPIQIEAQIGQDSEISPQISLWDQGGSQVIRGNLIVIPLNNSFLYVEPLYLKSGGDGARPELKRVIVADGERVVMRETLDQALAVLIDVPAVDIGTDTIEIDTSGTSSSIPLPDDVDGAIQGLILSANEQIQLADEALQSADWAAYGEAQEQLKSDIERLLELSGVEAP